MPQKLDGLDPLSTRPQWLHVKMKSSSLNAKQVCCDVKPHPHPTSVMIMILNEKISSLGG